LSEGRRLLVVQFDVAELYFISEVFVLSAIALATAENKKPARR
jgi:hypothetical protein